MDFRIIKYVFIVKEIFKKYQNRTYPRLAKVRPPGTLRNRTETNECKLMMGLFITKLTITH